MTIRNGFFYILFLLLFFNSLYSQQKNWCIQTKTNHKIRGAHLTRFEKDVLFIKVNTKEQSIPLESIKTIESKKTSSADLLGTIGGIIAGGFLAYQFEQKTLGDQKEVGFNTVTSSGFGMVIGGLVGYKAGAAAAGNNKYDLYRIKNKDKKIKILLKLIQKNQDAPGLN